jgi:hypothetical protein
MLLLGQVDGYLSLCFFCFLFYLLVYLENYFLITSTSLSDISFYLTTDFAFTFKRHLEVEVVNNFGLSNFLEIFFKAIHVLK